MDSCDEMMTYWQICRCICLSDLLLLLFLACIKSCEELTLRMRFWATQYNCDKRAYNGTASQARDESSSLGGLVV